MVEFQIAVLPAAVTDIESIGRYIATAYSDPLASKRIVEGIIKVIESLGYMPERGRILKGGDASAIRVVTYKHFAIAFQVDKRSHCVTVALVAYGGRNYKAIINNRLA